MAIEKELWLEIIKEQLVPSGSFVNESVNLSEFVENNVLHLAEAGVSPEVLVDNNVFPIPMSVRTDGAKDLPLHTLDTKNTIVRNVEKMELSYDKMASVTKSHKNALAAMIAKQCAFNWAPQSTAAMTPVFATTGAANISNLKAATFADFLNIEAKFRTMDVDVTTLVVVLSPGHLADLQNEDLKLYKDVLQTGRLFNMKMFVSSVLPYYSAAGEKLAFGATPGATDTQASIVYSKEEVGRAIGDADVFAKYDDPEQRADIIGFQQRFMGVPLRGKYISAIYSAAVPVVDESDDTVNNGD